MKSTNSGVSNFSLLSFQTSFASVLPCETYQWLQRAQLQHYVGQEIWQKKRSRDVVLSLSLSLSFLSKKQRRKRRKVWRIREIREN